MTSICTVSVLNPDWEAHNIDLETDISKTVIATLEKATLPSIVCNRSIEVTVSLTNDELIHHLNLSYRGKDNPTNVLSFACADDPEFGSEVKATPPEVPVSVGDVMLSYETIVKEAQDQNKSLKDHLTHLAVHGTLHLLGYDHEDDKDAEEMETLECEILAALSIKNPYEQNAAEEA